VLVPSGGKHVVESFAAVYDAVLSKSIWGVEFFMICDGDSLPAAAPRQTLDAQQSGRLRILSRYHLENYFLDEEVWAAAFADIEPPDSWLRSPAAIREALRESAKQLVSYATALYTASKLRASVGSLDVMPQDCHAKTLGELQDLLLTKVQREKERVEQCLDKAELQTWMEEYFTQLTTSLESDSDEWKHLIPGRPLLSIFANRAGLTIARAKTLYLNTASSSDRQPFAEIEEMFAHFSQFE